MRGSAMDRRRLVLIIDHDLELVELLRGLLTDEGFQPLTNLTLEAIAVLPVENRPDLIMLDVQVSHPQPDTALLARLAGSTALAGTPLLLTATDAGLLRATVAALGCPRTDWIAKPFDLDELLRKVEALLTGQP